MKGGLIVNVFSQFIQQKSAEQKKPYDKVLKSFWTNKKLQKEWKDYKDNQVKQIFVPQQRPVAYQSISYPLHQYTSSMDYRPDEEVPTPTETKGRTWENTFRGRVLKELEDVEGELSEVVFSPPTPQPKKRQPKKRKVVIDEEPELEDTEGLIEDEFPNGLPDLDAPLREWFQTPKRRMDELRKTEEKLLELYEKRDDKDYINTPMEYRRKLNLEINYWYDRQKELIGLLLETEPAVETINVMGKKVIMTRTGTTAPKPTIDDFFEYQRKKKQRIEGRAVSWVPFEYILPLRQNYPPKVRALLQQKGNEHIERLTIYRAPLTRSTNLLLQAFTTLAMRGKFQERLKDLNYDKLYHLALIAETKEGSRIFINKNEVIEIELNPKLSPEAELKPIDLTLIPPNLTINQMLSNTQQRMGKRYFVYNAATNNCQDYILNILEANNIGDQSDREFVKQDVQYLFKGASRTITFASFLTSLSALKNRIIEGNGLYKVQSVLFDRKQWLNPEKAAEWLKSHSYLNKGVDVKENTYRFRQMNPAYVKKQGYKRFVTQPLGDSGVSLILAYK